MILDSHSSWAGFGTEYIEALHGEFPKTSIWTWGIESNIVSYPTFGLTVDKPNGETIFYSSIIVDLRRDGTIYTTPPCASYPIMHLNRYFIIMAYFRSVFSCI